MTSWNNEALKLEFPCAFPIKVVGVASNDFETTLCEIAKRHDPDFSAATLQRNQSRSGKYQSLTLGITAVSKVQLDAIYTDLKACESVLWAL